jgi:hypothetical protein
MTIRAMDAIEELLVRLFDHPEIAMARPQAHSLRGKSASVDWGLPGPADKDSADKDSKERNGKHHRNCDPQRCR